MFVLEFLLSDRRHTRMEEVTSTGSTVVDLTGDASLQVTTLDF